MLLPTVAALLLTCELCACIRVPASWNERDSEVIPIPTATQDFGAETFTPQNNPVLVPKPVPVEYFEYTAKKPQFAIDVASFHGVQSPEKHYSAYPIKPHTGSVKPELGKHRIVNSGNSFYKPLQEFANINEHNDKTAPVSSSYEVFHPYEAEIPSFQELYKDPILNKIRGDLENSKTRLQKYEKEAGEPNISKEEYLENSHKTGNRLVPHRNVPAPYEIHRPQRRPVYYSYKPRHNHRDNYLNHRLRHPWNQYVKVLPAHYQPLKNHIHHLRQNHALKYDDERNEYPKVVSENYSDPKDGYDIYEKGRDRYVQLRNNVDESINKAVMENRPAKYEKLEALNNDSSDNEEDDENEFVPIKNYAQVRKTETYRHLPKSAALLEADTLDEIRNAPRLREAVKSTKAQTVYSEEGYEDAAYDHAGEQKHAAENEGHGGFLKQHELSGGKYKIPSESGAFDNNHGSVYRDKLVDNKKWGEDNQNVEKEKDEEDYTDEEHEILLEATNHQEQEALNENTSRNKRENVVQNLTDISNNTTDEILLQSESSKPEIKFEVPQIDLNSTFLEEKEILRIAKLKITPKKENLEDKYPYYFRNLRQISKDSPLRYAENLKLIPRKSKGGTEFYNSRSDFECPEIDDVPDPVPEKLKTGNNPEDVEDNEESSRKGEENFDTAKKQPRLKGLGDKIDCFKAKYFGENPLDSPFFKEDIISNPEPLKLPNLATYKLGRLSLKGDKGDSKSEASKSQNILYQPLKHENLTDLYNLIEKLRNDKNESQDGFLKNIELFSSALKTPKLNDTQGNHKANVYSEIINKIKNNTLGTTLGTINNLTSSLLKEGLFLDKNDTYSPFHNKKYITKSTPTLRKKRAVPFTYEPYKIIRDGQVQDSKKTTTTGNVSPLIKQLQSSKIVDKVTKSSELESSNSPTKFVNTRTYKDIGKNDRKTGSKNGKPEEPAFVDVSIDSRRGEPRYEIRHPNHKSEYTPVENKKTISVEDYKSQTNKDDKDVSQRSTHTNEGEKSFPQRSAKIQKKPYFDVNKYLPPIVDLQKVEASNTVRKTVPTSTPSPKKMINRSSEEEDEDYNEYDDEVHERTTTTTTTSPKPSFRRRIRPTPTITEEPYQNTEQPRLRLVTRFRDYKPDNFKKDSDEPTTKSTIKKTEIAAQEIEPKYREKTSKLTKSTLVTDTKKYGEDDEDDDMRQEEIDEMMGIKQDMDEYMPMYEIEEKNRKVNRNNDDKQRADDDDEDENDSDDDDDEIEDDIEEDDEDDNESDEKEDYDEDEDDDDELTEKDDEEKYESSETTKDGYDVANSSQPVVTTPEPVRTLAITTDAPIPTSSARSAKLQVKPVVTRKKIEIHKELPFNKSSPHITQYKQDIKEEEIIKEIPRQRRPNKHVETLELYKDENLPKEINKLSDVEVFKENLNLNGGPKHGGNYRKIPPNTVTPVTETKPKADTEASQTEFKKDIRQDGPQKIRISLKSLDDKPEQKSAKFELSEPTQTTMHGGNLRYKSKSRRNNKSEKLIELQEEDDDADTSTESQENYRYSSKRGRPMHGGNYRSANLKAEKQPETTEPSKKSRAKEARTKSADLLNSFVQAVPILTTTPRYILDPSKRMYYYVDT